MLPEFKSVPPLEQKPELSTMERIAIPGLLMAALYSAYSTALAGIRHQNEIPNTIFQIGVYPPPPKPMPVEMATILFKDDWIPVWIGNCFYSL